MEFLTAVLPYLPIVGIIIVVLVLLFVMIKVVSGNEVLVVTGVGATKKITKKVKVMRDGKEVEEEHVSYEPKVRIAGASLVIPFIQQARKFDICVMKASKEGDTMKTKTGVEIDIDWGISYAPNADSVESLLPCIRQFLDKDKREIEDIIKNAVAGGLRAVISTMTPQEVMTGKDTLDERVKANISDQMAELGYKVQLYIQEVRDTHNSTYYYDIAAKDRETTRREAANITAEADQDVRKKKAAMEQAAKTAELESEVAVAERTKETAIKKAEFKAETDRAAADAEIAGELRKTERQKELEIQKGEVAVTTQEQSNRAAEAKQKVAVTEAETEKKQSIIKAEAQSEQKKIEAAAEAAVQVQKASGTAEAKKKEAEGSAAAAKIDAAGKAEAKKLEADAESEKTRKIGEAEAAAIAAKGKAEAEAIEAKGRAEAEAARALSDAQAANDRVNFEIRKLEIERDTKVQIATNVATVMANIGEKATFYDFGGKSADGSSDLLTSVLSNIPQIFAKANLENKALNGGPVTDTLNQLVGAVAEPLKALAEKKTVIKESENPGNSENADNSAQE